MDHDHTAQYQATQRVYVRRRALGGALHLLRTHRGQTIRAAAQAAGMSPMTWTRLEHGLPVKGRTYYALDAVIGPRTARGTVARALEDDVLMVALLGTTGTVAVDGVTDVDASAFLAAFVERIQLGAVQPAPAPPTPHGMSELELATALVERLRQGPSTSELERQLVDSALAAMPDLYERPRRRLFARFSRA